MIETTGKEKKAGDIIHLQVMQQAGVKDIALLLETKYQKPFTISRMAKPTVLQAAILKDWLKSKTD